MFLAFRHTHLISFKVAAVSCCNLFITSKLYYQCEILKGPLDDHKRNAKFTEQPCQSNWGGTWNDRLMSWQYYEVDDITKSHSPTWRIRFWSCTRQSRWKTQALIANALLWLHPPGGVLCAHGQASCHLGIQHVSPVVMGQNIQHPYE